MSDEYEFEEKQVRTLEIHCPNGYVGYIMVTRGPAFWAGINIRRGVWHYEVNNGLITLTGVGSDSVKFLDQNGNEVCHQTVTNWELRS